MPFQKGQSGNPGGRPRGARNRTSALVHSLIEGAAEDLALKVIAMAKEGDLGAMRMCMDRIAAARKYDPGCCELPKLENAHDAVEAMDRIANAVTGGDLAPSEAAALAKVVEIHLLAVQVHSIDARLTALERKPAPRHEPQSRDPITLPLTRD